MRDLEFKDCPVRPSTSPGGAKRNFEVYQRERQAARTLEHKAARLTASAALAEQDQRRARLGCRRGGLRWARRRNLARARW